MLHVACSSDARFAPDCAVMLASLVATNEAPKLDVHFLHDDSLSARDLDRLRAIVVGAGARFNPIPIVGDRAHLLARSDRFPLRAWYRVLLPELLPQLDRILYVDADALITASLDQLWQTELGDRLVGAVTNPLYESMVPRIRTELGLRDAGHYFNSGVLLIDLDAWRAADTTDALLRFAAQHPGLIWPDQDVLNGVLHSHRLHLHPRWNAMPGIWELPQRYLPYSRAEVREAASNPAIVHFVGPHKPWHFRSRHPYRDVWFHYLGQTPWRERPTEGRSLWQAMLRPLPSAWAYRVEVRVARAEPTMSSGIRRARARLGRLRGRRR